MCYFYNITQECDKPGHNVNFIIPGGDEGFPRTAQCAGCGATVTI